MSKINKFIEVDLKAVKDNPFRDRVKFPFRQDKIDRLMESINATGFWPNVICRLGDGEVQIAYGHHRVEAAKKAGVKKATLVCQDLNDKEMLDMMVQENAIEDGHDFMTIMNSISAVVQAYADGTIELEKPSPKNRDKWRLAPGFTAGEAKTRGEVGRAAASKDAEMTVSLAWYTAFEVADYLGWTHKDPNPKSPTGKKAADRVLTALAALELIELAEKEGGKWLKASDFEGIGVTQAQLEVAAAKRRYEAAKKEIELASTKKEITEIQTKLREQFKDTRKKIQSTEGKKTLAEDLKAAREGDRYRRSTPVIKKEDETQDITKLVAKMGDNATALVDLMETKLAPYDVGIARMGEKNVVFGKGEANRTVNAFKKIIRMFEARVAQIEKAKENQ